MRSRFTKISKLPCFERIRNLFCARIESNPVGTVNRTFMNNATRTEKLSHNFYRLPLGVVLLTVSTKKK